MSEAPADDKPKAIVDKDAQANVAENEAEQKKAVSDFNQGADGELAMHVKVHSPFHDYYDGQAFSISGENATGPFDILPHHHSFISLLMPCTLVVRTAAKDEQRIQISGGVMHVKADEVIVFLDV
jgi:hypothetical protein